MKHHSILRRALLTLALGLAALPPWADDDCDAPVERWQSREAVRQMAARQTAPWHAVWPTRWTPYSRRCA